MYLAGFVVVVACSVLWSSTIAPLIARLFGVPLAGGFWRTDRKNQHLTNRQYIWAYGVWSFGMTLFVVFTMLDVVDWKLMGDPMAERHLHPARMIVNLLGTILSGIVFGYWTAPDKHIEHS